MDKLDRREEIVLAARELFVNYGFKKTTLDDVARAVRLGKSALYHYFQNKEDLFKAVIGDTMKQGSEVGMEALYSSPDIKECLVAYVRQSIEFHRDMHNAHYFLLGEFDEFFPLIKEDMYNFARSRVDALKERLQEAVDKGQLKPLDINAHAMMLSMVDIQHERLILMEEIYGDEMPSYETFVDIMIGRYYTQQVDSSDVADA